MSSQSFSLELTSSEFIPATFFVRIHLGTPSPNNLQYVCLPSNLSISRLFNPQNQSFKRELLPLLPESWPPGPWKVASLVGPDPFTGRFSIAQLHGGPVDYHAPQRYNSLWFPVTVDTSALRSILQIRPGMHLVTFPHRDPRAPEGGADTTIGGVYKTLRCHDPVGWPPREVGVEHEAMVHRILEGKGIGPAFWGLVTSNVAGGEGQGGFRTARGFVMEQVEGRSAGRDDLEACREVLGRLHALGIVHGGLKKETFLVQGGPQKKVVMVGFGKANLWVEAGGDECRFEMKDLELVLSE